MKKLISSSVVLVFAIVNLSFAMFTSDDAGTASAQFLKLGVGARAVAMGESYTAVSDDATAVYWNPAGMNRVESRAISFMHAIWFEDIFYDWFSYVQDCSYGGKMGAAIQYLSYGSITETDSTGLEGDDFTPYDMALLLSYARQFGDIDAGASLKYISSKIDDESASAIAVDLGAIHKMMEDKLSLGLAVQNLGTVMKYIDEEDSLPLTIKVGASYKLMTDLLATADVNMASDSAVVLGGGAEYSYDINDNLSAAVRIGYNTRTKDTGGTNGVTAGAGIKYQSYNVDYAFMPFGDLGNTHRISFGIRF